MNEFQIGVRSFFGARFLREGWGFANTENHVTLFRTAVPFRHKPVKLWVFCPQSGTAVLKRVKFFLLIPVYIYIPGIYLVREPFRKYIPGTWYVSCSNSAPLTVRCREKSEQRWKKKRIASIFIRADSTFVTVYSSSGPPSVYSPSQYDRRHHYYGGP